MLFAIVFVIIFVLSHLLAIDIFLFQDKYMLMT